MSEVRKSIHSNPSDAGDPSGSAEPTDNRLLGVSRVSKPFTTDEIEQVTDIACKSTSENVWKIGDTTADKYALELPTSMKKEKWQDKSLIISYA